jgi:hypothetical protein
MKYSRALRKRMNCPTKSEQSYLTTICHHPTIGLGALQGWTSHERNVHNCRLQLSQNTFWITTKEAMTRVDQNRECLTSNFARPT